MKVAVAFDHRGVKLRERLLEELAALGHDVVDLGTDSDAVRIDYPVKAQMLGLDILVQRRGGGVERLTESGSDQINLPQLSDQLYRSARWLRVFVARGVALPGSRVLDVLQRPPEELRAALARGEALL